MGGGRALVLNATSRQSLVAIRCLGRRAIAVTAGSGRRASAGGLSKYADRQLFHPDPRTEPESFVDTLERELRASDYGAVLASDGATVKALVEHRQRLGEHVGLPYPPPGTLAAGLDKALTVEVAREVGVPHPTTIAPDGLDRETVASRLSYPVVLKPRRSHGRNGVEICDSFGDLKGAYARVTERYGPALIQEFVPHGGERGVYAVYDYESNLRAATVQARVRSNPPEGGASTLRRTVADPGLLARADELLSALDWQGPAMVEFRIDARDGEAKLMEINPRLWGSLALSVAAGVDFPYLLYQLGTDGRCDIISTYRASVYARRALGELGYVLNHAEKTVAVREVLGRPDGPCSFDVLSLDDPLAAVSYALHETGTFTRRALSGSGAA